MATEIINKTPQDVSLIHIDSPRHAPLFTLALDLALGPALCFLMTEKHNFIEEFNKNAR
jgi:hypothetical protein